MGGQCQESADTLTALTALTPHPVLFDTTRECQYIIHLPFPLSTKPTPRQGVRFIGGHYGRHHEHTAGIFWPDGAGISGCQGASGWTPGPGFGYCFGRMSDLEPYLEELDQLLLDQSDDWMLLT